MKFHTLLSAAGILALSGTAALAVEVTGGQIGLSWSAFEEDTDISKTSIDGSVEVGFNRNFALQFDATRHNFNYSEADSLALMLHAIYHINDATSVGAFIGREDIEGEDFDYLGVEVGYEADQFEIEAYLGEGSAEGEDAAAFGAQAFFDVNRTFKLGLVHDRVNFDGLANISTTGARGVASYGGTDLYVEIGQFRGEIDGLGAESETYIGLGVEFNFGADRGSTFGRRGLGHLIPGS